MALKFQLDNISPDGTGYVAYVEMRDDADIVIARKCVPYSEDTDTFQAAIANKFSSAISKHSKKEAIATQAASVLSGITAAKISEVAAKTIEAIKE